MIFKKPFAFLIKNFKKIHLILVVTMSFLLYRSYNIFSFFSDAISNNYSISVLSDTSSYYVNGLIYLILIFTLSILIAIYYLLRHKNKPRKFYRNAIIYYLILLFFFVFISGVFQDLIGAAVESKTIIAYRDISLIMMVPQIGFIIYSIITVVGFNIKKFNFGEDLKEFEISEDDNEEFELNVGFEGYKTKRSIRKTMRELRYYVLENKFIISCIGIVLTIFLSFYLVSSLQKKDNNLNINASAINNNFSIKVIDSIISNLKPNGDTIENGKYYLAVKIDITNIADSKVSLDYSNYRLVTKNRKIYPNLQASHYFFDFASPYIGDKLRIDESRTIVLAYEVTEEELNDNFILKIYKGTINRNNKLVDDYNDVKLNPKKQLDKGDASIVSLNEELLFSSSNVGNTKFKLTSYEYTNKYIYTYDSCHNDECSVKKDIVTIDYLNTIRDAVLMVVDYDFILDEKTTYYKYNSKVNDFVSNFMKIKYVINGEIRYSVVVDRTPAKITDKLIIQVDKDISLAEEVQAIFTIRNKNYIIKLK
ncbi:MAG: DUF4352 domain-containing protein [Bacilli bacterium]|nr:DUF4352 domain-containing protein [Bacilli bacterium]